MANRIRRTILLGFTGACALCACSPSGHAPTNDAARETIGDSITREPVDTPVVDAGSMDRSTSVDDQAPPDQASDVDAATSDGALAPLDESPLADGAAPAPDGPPDLPVEEFASTPDAPALLVDSPGDRDGGAAADGSRASDTAADDPGGSSLEVAMDADGPSALDVGAGIDGQAGIDTGANSGERIWVYLMAGQSNMAGMGMDSELAVADGAVVAGATIYADVPNHPSSHTRQWLPLGPGFGFGDDRFGPELAFGRRLREVYPERRIAIIKVAQGATGLADRWTAQTGDLYQLLVREARAQLAVLAGLGRPQVAGFLWMQGESDGEVKQDADGYQQNLTDFVTALRADLGSAFLPFLAGLIAMDAGWPYGNEVRAATAAVATQQGRVDVIETDDLSMWGGDLPHYDTAGTLALGRRFADAMAAMQKPVRWRFPADFGVIQGDACWLYRGRAADGGATPLSFDSVVTRWTGGGAVIGNGLLQASATTQAELVFWPPCAGHLDVTLNASMTEVGEGGATIGVTSASQAVFGPAAIAYPTRVWGSFGLDVSAGDEVRFLATAGGDNSPGATTWDIDITMSQVDE